MAFGANGAKRTNEAKPWGVAELESKLEEKIPAQITEEDKEKNDTFLAQPTEHEEKTEQIEEKKAKEPKVKSDKKKKSQKDYYKNFYNVRIDFPLEAKEKIKIAAEASGTLNKYITNLVNKDLRENIDKYKKIAEQNKQNNWDF